MYNFLNLVKYFFITIFIILLSSSFSDSGSASAKPLPEKPGVPEKPESGFVPSTGTIGYISDTCGLFKVYGCKDVFEIIFGALVPSLYVLISGISAIFFLVGAVRLVTSAGNTDQVKAAWGQIQSNFVGLLVVLLSVTIFFVVISLVGIGFSSASDITNIGK